MRRLLFALILMLLLGCGLGAYLLLQSPQRVLAATEWAVDTLTPLNLELRDASADFGSHRLQAREIHLFQDDNPGVPLVSIMDFSGDVRPRDVLFNRLRHARLKAASVVVYVSEQDEAEDPSPNRWMSYLRWLPRELDIGSIHVVSHGETVWVAPLRNIRGERIDDGQYRLTGAAQYEGEPLDVTLYLYALRSASGFRGIQLRGEFHATRSSRLAIAEGELRGGIEEFSYDLSLKAAFPDIRVLLDQVPGAPDIAGHLQVLGRARGDLEHFQLSDAEFHLFNPPAYEFSARGDFLYRGHNDTELNLDASGQMAELSYLMDWISLDLTSLGRAEAQLSLHGPLDAISVEQFDLHTRHSEGLRVDITGSLEAGALAGDTTGNNQVQVTLSGPRLAVLKQWLGDLPFEPGPWELTGRLTGDREALTINELQGTLGPMDGTQFSAAGTIGRVALEPPISATSVTGIDIQLSASAGSLEDLNLWLGTTLPVEHAMTARAQVTGSADRLAIRDGEGRLEGSDITLSLSGLAGQIVTGEAWRPEGFGGQLALSLSDTSALSQYVDTAIPVLGAVQAGASLSQEGGTLGLKGISGTIDSDQIRLTAEGQIDDLLALQGTVLDISFSRLDTRNLVHSVRDAFTFDRPLGNLEGRGQLVQSAGQWNIKQLRVANAGAQGIELDLSGELSDLAGLPRGDLEGSLAITDQELLQALAGRPLAPLHTRLTSDANQQGMRIAGDTRLGESSWHTRAEIGYQGGELTAVSVDIESPGLRLADLGFGVTDNEDGQEENDKQANPLEALIERLPAYPLRIGARLQNVRGEQTAIRDLKLEIEGSEGQYVLRELNIDYERAVAEVRGIIDLKARPPAISLGGQALSIDLTHMLRDLGVDSDVEGILNLRGGLSARGTNSSEWLNSLDGSLALALEDGVIEGAAYDVLATDLLAWLYSGAALEKSTHVDCTMAQFSLKSGVATTDSIFIESPRMIASGKGKLDFVQRKLDITLTPRSKNRLLQIPSSVTLHGDMTSPRTRVSPIAATADASAEALMLIPGLTMKLFGIKLGRETAARPCEASLGG